MRTALTFHEPPEELCMLSSLHLTAAFNITRSESAHFLSYTARVFAPLPIIRCTSCIALRQAMAPARDSLVLIIIPPILL